MAKLERLLIVQAYDESGPIGLIAHNEDLDRFRLDGLPRHSASGEMALPVVARLLAVVANRYRGVPNLAEKYKSVLGHVEESLQHLVEACQIEFPGMDAETLKSLKS